MNAYLQADTRDHLIEHWSELVAAVPDVEPSHPHRPFGAIHLRGTGASPRLVPSASDGGSGPGVSPSRLTARTPPSDATP